MQNQDLKLCAEFGTADRVRRWCECWSAEETGKTAAHFYSFVNGGAMPFPPRTAGLFAYVMPIGHEAAKETAQVVADTLYSLTGEKREQVTK